MHLGLTYEKLLRKAGQEQAEQALEGEEDFDDYDEEDAKSTFNAAGGPQLTREMRRELKRVRCVTKTLPVPRFLPIFDPYHRRQ